MIFDPAVRPFDEFDFVRLVSVLDRHQGTGRKVTIHAPNGTALMGSVPHETAQPPLDLFLKPSFFNPYARP